MISVIVPVYNEENGIASSLNNLSKVMQDFPGHEIIVVNDGSTDRSIELVNGLGLKNLHIIEHADNLGYGKSLFDGILTAKNDCIAIIDGDGSYLADNLKDLYSYYPKYDMVVGARQGKEYRRGLLKRPARIFFEYLVQYATGRRVPDVNSGLRIFKKHIMMGFNDSLCTGFSFTTTLTLLFLLNHYCVKYVPIEYMDRVGKSKIRHFKDTLRAGQIIVQAIVHYNPMKLFLLLAFCNLMLGLAVGIVNHIFLNIGFLSMAAALCVASFIPIFSFGLISDQLRKIYNLNRERVK